MTYDNLLPSYEFEKLMGIPYFFTSTQPIHGVIKYRIDDFYVEEIFKNGIFATQIDLLNNLFPNKGNYLYVVIQKRNLSVNELLDYISNKLRINKSSIGISGIKDKRAITTQILSLKGINSEHVKILNSSRVKILGSFYSYGPLRLGTHEGNHFIIIIRNIKLNKDKLIEISSFLQNFFNFNLIPNFFGYQRFGIPRSVTHLIGRELLLNNFEKAIDLILGYPDVYEPEEIRNFREVYNKTRDLNLCLKYLPSSLYYEKIVIEYLLQHQNDYEGAIAALPATTLRMFLESYSSYIFNILLTKRLSLGIEPIKGDLITPLNRYTPINYSWEIGREIDLDKAVKLISNRKATLVLPVLGYKIKLGYGLVRDILNEILINEGLRLKDFKFIVKNKPVIIRGSYRSAFVNLISKLRYTIEEDLILDGNALILDFSLPRGSYATIVLREYMKSPNEGFYIGKI